MPRSLDPKRKVLHPLSTAAVITCRLSVHTQTVFFGSAGAAAEARILTEVRCDGADATTASRHENQNPSSYSVDSTRHCSAETISKVTEHGLSRGQRLKCPERSRDSRDTDRIEGPAMRMAAMGERILRERTREEGRYLFFGFEARGGRRGSTLGLWQSPGRRMLPL